MRYRFIAFLVVAISLSMLSSTVSAAKPVIASSIAFSNTSLLLDSGSSEPAVTIGPDGTTVFTSLSWITFGTNVWKTTFGVSPALQGIPDNGIVSVQLGGEEADADIGSTGPLHFTSLIALVNPPFNAARFGVSAITCPNADTSSNFANCKAQILDTTEADRPWITSDGATVYLSYHDSGSSTLINVWRSDDDGFTWMKVGDPISGQGGLTAMSTFNNDQGPIVADPTTHSVFAIYAAGQGGHQKATTANFNNIVVSRSVDEGQTWNPTIVFHSPVNTALNNVFPALAVDPTNGKLYAAWSDGHTVWLAASSDHGTSWISAVSVNSGDATTALFPWVAAFAGKVDVVFYATTASSKDDPAAVWNTYMAQTTDDGSEFTQATVSAHPNHVGVVCTFGTGCARGTRNLLDLFEIAINPLTGKAAIIFTDDTLTTYTRSDGTVAPLPQVVVAWES